MEYGDLISILRNEHVQSGTGQYCDSIIVNDYYEQEPPFQINSEWRIKISRQLAEGMRYLSFHHFIHRDLAARNCLVNSAGDAKVADFGLSRDVYANDYYRIGGDKPQPVRWMSPESLTLGLYTLESDVWAYGVLLWEIYSNGVQPYFGLSNANAMELIIAGVLLYVPCNCPPVITRIMTGCWKEENDRMTFKEICEMFKNVSTVPSKDDSGYENPKALIEHSKYSTMYT